MPSQIPEKWFYATLDLTETSQGMEESHLKLFTTEEFLQLLPTLVQLGITVIVLSDYHLADLGALNKIDSKLVTNLKKIAEATADVGVKIIPEIMQIGASSQILLNDPQLVAGAPVDRMEFIVKQNEGGLIAVPDPKNLLAVSEYDFTETGQFEKHFNVNPGGAQVEPGNGVLNIQMSPANDWCLFSKFVVLKPRHQYELTLTFADESATLVKDHTEVVLTLEVGGDPPIYDLLRFDFDNAKPTSGTATWQVGFNSLGYDSAKLTVSLAHDPCSSAASKPTNCKSPPPQTVVVEELSIRQVSGINLLKREDLPITVVGPNGNELKEVVDFERWFDDRMQHYGGYFLHHPGDGIPIRLTENSQVESGQVLSVSYSHAVLPTDKGQQVCVTANDRKLDQILADQIQLLNEILSANQPKRWLVNHEEIRFFGHEPNDAGQNPGDLLGGLLKRCLNIINQNAPGTTAVLTSDMYDRYHNATDQLQHPNAFFPLVNGTFFDSQNAIPTDGSVPIWNWILAERNLDESPESEDDLQEVKNSFKQFSNLGVSSQIIGTFFDVFDKEIDSSEEEHLANKAAYRLREKLHFQAARENATITGCCYYTTKGNLDYLEEFVTTIDDVFGGN